MLSYGAQWLTGYAIEIRPCPLPPPELLRILYHFLAFAEKNDALMIGHSFSRDGKEQVQVLAHEPQDGKVPFLELKTIYNPEYGIYRQDTPQAVSGKDNASDLRGSGERAYESAPADLDPNDPVDAAILEQLRKNKSGPSADEQNVLGNQTAASVASAEQTELRDVSEQDAERNHVSKSETGPKKIPPLPAVKARVLYKELKPFDAKSLHTMILAAVDGYGMPVESCELLDSASERDAIVRCGEYDIAISQNEPLEQDASLDMALQSFSVQSQMPEAADLARASASCIKVTVQKAVSAGSPPLAFSNSDEAFKAMVLAKLLTMLIVKQSNPDAVFWVPSAIIMSPASFDEFSGIERFLYLFAYAHLVGEIDPVTGTKLSGVNLIGSEWLTGYALEMRPCDMPADKMVDILYAFLKHAARDETLIQDGDVFARHDQEKIMVHIHQSPGDRPDTIELKVIESKMPGVATIGGQASAGEAFASTSGTPSEPDHLEQTKLDPKDPVDAAILEQLRARDNQVQSHGAAVSEEENDQAFREIDKPVLQNTDRNEPAPPEFSRRTDRPAPPPTKRVSMQELRSFALNAQATSEADEEPKPKRGLLGKLFGKKSG
eukprot:g1377.t1